MQTWKWGGILLSGLAAACDGPPPSSPGVETAKPSRSRADTPSPSRTGDPAPFQIDDIQIGIPTQHYLDPEFIDVGGHYKALYTDGVHVPGSLWVADIDPVTGLFVSGHGKDLLLDTDIPPIYETIINGPEWGVDRNGLSIYYTKKDAAGIKQLWRADLTTPPVLTQLTYDTVDNVQWAATLNPDDPSLHLIFVRYMPGPVLFWSNENNIAYDHPIRGYVWPGNNGPRFVPGTPYFVYSKQIAADTIELIRVDTRDGTETVVTNDGIKKVDTWGFLAPEFNDAMCYSALISDTEIGIYRYLQPTDPYATRFATLRVPAGDSHPYIRSIEILQTNRDLVDQTYFAFLGSDNPVPLEPCDGSMWIASLGSDPAARFVRRVDEGALSGATAYRQEPELLVGMSEVFLYYNAYKEGGVKELRRCRTGIPVRRPPINIDVPLAAGYTLIAPPLTPEQPLTAEGLARQINAQGGTCTSVIAYDSAAGAFVTHPVGTALNNFTIEVGKGYFVRCATATTWRARGCRFLAPNGAVPLKEGYNLVGLPIEPWAPGKYTAEGAGIEMNAQGGGATQLIRYDEAAGQFVTHPVGTALQNFTLDPGRGYFIRCTRDSVWTVSR